MEIEAFISKYWGKPGGAERATYQMFLTELAQLVGGKCWARTRQTGAWIARSAKVWVKT